jgi:transcriptional regulator with XRE-family HTH domain
MRNEVRDLARRKLDEELRLYRLAGKKHPTRELLRRVRQVLGVPVAEVAQKLGVNRSVIFRLEQSERRGTISLRAMTRVANAMNCKVVYAVIPRDGKTLDEMADRRKWSKLLEVGVRD